MWKTQCQTTAEKKKEFLHVILGTFRKYVSACEKFNAKQVCRRNADWVIIKPGICNWWICQLIKNTNTNQNQSITINRLLLEINEKSMSNRWDRILWLFIDLHRKSNLNIANKYCHSMEINIISRVLCDYRLIIDWPIQSIVLIDFNRLYTPGIKLQFLIKTKHWRRLRKHIRRTI